jgi:menaquinone-9 beta-reductase
VAYDLVIVGAGPAGLACARRAAARGLATLVVERQEEIGRKVCAGGITWNGLLRKSAGNLAEKAFSRQQVSTPRQNITVTAANPIIATINRETLGRAMAAEALAAGAEIRLGVQATAINGEGILCTGRKNGRREKIAYRYLVGADGSSSLVRRFLRLPVAASGIGIHYQLPGDLAEMEWHLDHRLFGSGYAWVFPHRDTFSLGAYADARVLGARALHQGLCHWARQRGYEPLLRQGKVAAERINFDYRGWRFGNIFLIGDAAGLASGLTGEGIYPAIVSGEVVAGCLDQQEPPGGEMDRLVRNQRRHRRLATLRGRHPLLALLCNEILVYSLHRGWLDFRAAEMAR